MAKDFVEIDRLEHEAGILAPQARGKEELVNKFVKAWENETARRAVKGGAAVSMALTLAACGGGSGGGDAAATTPVETPTTPVETPTLSLQETIDQGAAGTLPVAFNVQVASADLLPATVAEIEAGAAAVDAALNVTEFDAATAAGEIVVTLIVEDTIENILAGARAEGSAFAGLTDQPNELLTINATDEVITVNVEDAQLLIALGVNPAEGVVPTIEDTATNIIDAAAGLVDETGAPVAAIAVTDEAVTLTVEQFEALAALGATFGEAAVVTVSDSAELILASTADLSAVAVVASDEVAADLSVAQFVTLEGLATTFTTAPNVSGALSDADDAPIAGVADLTLSVASATAGADAIASVLDASGTGTITFNFADAEDTVTLGAGSSITGFTVMNVVAGTVDVTAATIGAEVTQITVASGVVLTAAQFLALEGGVVGGSADAEVTVIVSNAAEAADVIAAAASLSGTFAANGISIQAAAGSGVTALQAAGFTADLDSAITEAEVNAALPPAIEIVLDAATAQDEFVATALANEDVAAELVNVDAALNAETAEFADVDAAIDLAVTADIAAINVALNGDDVDTNGNADNTAFVGTNGAAIIAEFDALIGDETEGLVADRATALSNLNGIDPELVTLANVVIAAQDVLDQANTNLATATAAVTTAINAAQTDAEGSTLPVGAVGLVFTIVDGVATLTYEDNIVETPPVVIGEVLPNIGFALNAEVSESQDGTTYTIGEATFDVAELDAVVTAAQAQIAANDTATGAQTALTEAQTDLDDQEALADADVGGTPAATAGEAYLLADAALDTAQDAKAAFEAELVDYNALVGLQDQAETLTTDLTAALDAIENGPDGTPAGLSIDVASGVDGAGSVDMAALGESVNDLYILDLADANAGAITVTNFAADGLDRIYTGLAGDYTFFELGAGQAIADDIGSATTLEIFAEQDGANVVLYVENTAAAGNDTTTDDVTIVTLSQVSLDNLTFDAANDILSASSVAP